MLDMLLDGKPTARIPSVATISGLLDKRASLRSLEVTLPKLVQKFQLYLLQLPRQTEISPAVQLFKTRTNWVRSQKVYCATGIRINYPSHNDPENIKTDIARCTSSWRGSNERRDYVLAQLNPETENNRQSVFRQSGLLPCKLLLVFRWKDKIPCLNNDGYMEIAHDLALVSILKFRSTGMSNENTGMIEVVKDKGDTGLKVIPIQLVTRAAHIIPSVSGGFYYINNYIDLEMYNKVY